MANVLDHVVEHMRKMKWETRHAWRLYIYDVFNESPVLAEVLDENPPGPQRHVAGSNPRSRGNLERRFF